MGLLYPHNQAAYETAVRMMAKTGKAAVIHPTGTGKSFIGLQLAADNPESSILWLSPSSYIFNTQAENWCRAGGAELPNLRTMTYARLMLLTEWEMRELLPAYVVLDEFHRCGAQLWGDGVQRLLRIYPKAKLLGLSATNIRYLDNQRDMADELFDGNIASEMSLGEAIVRGILSPPKYVLTVFRCRDDLQKYEERVKRQKSRAVRDEAEEILIELRHALDMADGLDVIFDKHMTERKGKYIVFCANAEHMREMVSRVPEWFHAIDEEAHIYTAYSADPETEKSFAQFTMDGSGHLRLLFCIDMLNEGIHVPDIDGVILLRPTVSPIIYKQQIGRALAAGKDKAPVIFDVVMNIENLYSIDSVQEEMQAAMTYYRSLGRDDHIVNETFRIVDEVHDCLELFDRLNNSLSASWDLMFQQAKKYREANGDLNVPKRFVTEEGYCLGLWLDTQRKVKAGRLAGNLGSERIRKLDELGMRWQSAVDESWERYYNAAKQYFIEHGNLDVKHRYETADGLKLGIWLTNIRTSRKSGIRNAYLTEERIQCLDEIGMQWNVQDYLFERNYAAAMEYHREHGDLNVPSAYVAENGVRLGTWISNLRTAYRKDGLHLTEEQRARMDALGMLWEGRYSGNWDRTYEDAMGYLTEHGSLDIPNSYKTASGVQLGRWVQKQKNAMLQGKLSESRASKIRRLCA